MLILQKQYHEHQPLMISPRYALALREGYQVHEEDIGKECSVREWRRIILQEVTFYEYRVKMHTFAGREYWIPEEYLLDIEGRCPDRGYDIGVQDMVQLNSEYADILAKEYEVADEDIGRCGTVISYEYIEDRDDYFCKVCLDDYTLYYLPDSVLRLSLAPSIHKGGDDQKHYIEAVVEPIEVMRKLFTPDEYIGFLKGNILKYRLRLGKKKGASIESDLAKIRQYEEWLGNLSSSIEG